MVLYLIGRSIESVGIVAPSARWRLDSCFYQPHDKSMSVILMETQRYPLSKSVSLRMQRMHLRITLASVVMLAIYSVSIEAASNQVDQWGSLSVPQGRVADYAPNCILTVVEAHSDTVRSVSVGLVPNYNRAPIVG